MTAPRHPRKNRSVAGPALVLLTLLAAVSVVGCGTKYFEIPIETPISAKLDITAFQRVLIAGFVTGGTDDVDANQETVRLLRSQLRTKSSLRVIDAEAMPLLEIAKDQDRSAAEPAADAAPPEAGAVPPAAGAVPASGNGGDRLPLPSEIKDEKDLEPYKRIFANTAYWRRIGEEYQNPLIVTGTVLFVPHSRANFVSRDVEQYDSIGRRRIVPQRLWLERKGFILRPEFIFIDGRTGATMHRESYREEILYSERANTPALSSYFELMDRLVPNFLSTLSTQKIRGTRVLLM